MDKRRSEAEELIGRVYGILFQRAPDPVGEVLFVNRLLSEWTLADLLRALVSSNEYAMLQKPAADYIRDLYCLVLNRDIAEGETISDWIRLEQEHGRPAVFELIAATPEASASGVNERL
jgi:hypothetical protein